MGPPEGTAGRADGTRAARGSGGRVVTSPAATTDRAKPGAEPFVIRQKPSRGARTADRRGAAAILLVLIVAGAVAMLTLRDLDGTPPGLFIDEVAIALTARSLWETGADLDGNRLPLFPLSFRDPERPIPV